MTNTVLTAGDIGPGSTRTWMHFYGTRGASLRLLVKGALLAIPTLGFYRFWLITRLRRYLWENTRIGGDAFTYLGTAKELLLGFLAAVAILLPVYLVYFLIGLQSETWRTFASFPLLLFFVVFGKFAEFRARRYRLTRTMFRGVRFTMTGSGIRYALMWAGWSLLTLVTLGMARPWQTTSLERYKVDNTRWGDLACRFEATGWSLFKQGIAIYAVLAAAILGALALTVLSGGYAAVSSLSLQGIEQQNPALAFLPLLFIFGILFAELLYQGVVWRWWLNGLRMSGLAVSTTLGRAAWLNANAKLLGLTIAAGAVVPLVILIVVKVTGFNFSMISPNVGFGLLLVAYVALILAFGVAVRQILVCGFWRTVVDSVEIRGLDVLDGAVAAGGPSSILGEGLAEALDVGAF